MVASGLHRDDRRFQPELVPAPGAPPSPRKIIGAGAAWIGLRSAHGGRVGDFWDPVRSITRLGQLAIVNSPGFPMFRPADKSPAPWPNQRKFSPVTEVLTRNKKLRVLIGICHI